jgi:hypothetical protein
MIIEVLDRPWEGRRVSIVEFGGQYISVEEADAVRCAPSSPTRVSRLRSPRTRSLPPEPEGGEHPRRLTSATMKGALPQQGAFFA